MIARHGALNYRNPIKFMRKAVAIPYVIALVLGVIVIATLAYWLISQAGKTTDTGSSVECKAKTFSFCVTWQNADPKCETSKPTEIDGCDVPKDNAVCKNLGLCKG